MPVAGQPSDARLLAEAAQRPAAFAAFYDRYEMAIAGYLVRRSRDPELAADLTAEVFAAALAAAGRYRAQGPTAAPWLFTIAHNKLVKSRRRGRAETAARRRLGISQMTASTPDELAAVEALLSADGWLVELLEWLPPDQREAVRAHILDERSYREIAGELEISEVVVRKRVSRGLSRLRAQLENPA